MAYTVNLFYFIFYIFKTPSLKEAGTLREGSPSPTCHTSCFTWLVSRVTCHIDKVLKLVGGWWGLLSMWPTMSSFTKRQTKNIGPHRLYDKKSSTLLTTKKLQRG